MCPQIFAIWVTKLLTPDEIRRFDGILLSRSAGFFHRQTSLGVTAQKKKKMNKRRIAQKRESKLMFLNIVPVLRRGFYSRQMSNSVRFTSEQKGTKKAFLEKLHQKIK